MRKFLIIAVCLFLRASLVSAQTYNTSYSGNITASGSTCGVTNACVGAPVGPYGSAAIGLSGTFSGTVQFEGCADIAQTNCQALNVTPSNSGTAVTSTTGAGIWQVNPGAYAYIRVRCSSYSSGTIVVTIGLSQASARNGGGGSAGTPAFPVTVTGGVSGGIPCFTSTTTEAASTLFPAGQVLLGGGSGACPTASTSANVSGNITTLGDGSTGIQPLIVQGSASFSSMGFARSGAGVDLQVYENGSTWCPATNAGTCLLSVAFPSGNVSTNGTFTIGSLGTGTNADFLCSSSGGLVLIQATACTISSVRFKQNIHPLPSVLGEVMKLKVVTFNRIPDVEHPDKDVNAYVKQIGLTAENVAKVDPKAAVYEQDGMTPKSYRQESIIAMLVKAVQEQQKEIEQLRQR